MDKYVTVKRVGRGHFGVVDLVKSSEDGKYYVIKQIELKDLSTKERNEAFSEVIYISKHLILWNGYYY